jgi:cysteine desulfurase/selenocysteine lyase
MDNIYRNDFPLFSAIENDGLIYFDNAATTQKPYTVIEAMERYYRQNNANPLRGLYDLSSRATEEYESARHVVAEFLNAKDCEIIFTRNASESLNLVAYTWAMANLKEGDEIVVSVTEHHSNILPWQMAASAKAAKVVFLEPDKETGEFSEDEFRKINSKTKLVAVGQVSNVLGITNPVKKNS